MEQKDYKAIAEIIKKNSIFKKTSNGILVTVNYPGLVNELADYFEENGFKGFDKKSKRPKVINDFNKKQFLKRLLGEIK